jgi:ubiquinol oxidase
MPVAEEARDYWNLPEDAVFRDVIKSIRADEVMHRELNHHFASLASDDKLESHEVEIVTERPG